MSESNSIKPFIYLKKFFESPIFAFLFMFFVFLMPMHIFYMGSEIPSKLNCVPLNLKGEIRFITEFQSEILHWYDLTMPLLVSVVVVIFTYKGLFRKNKNFSSLSKPIRVLLFVVAVLLFVYSLLFLLSGFK